MSSAHPGDAPASQRCEVLVIGGGPGGSTVSALLAEQGRDVVMLEKAHHPRFHIGESLLPANGAIFDQLGVRAEVERIGMPKWGVEFVSPDHEQRSTIDFGDAWDKSMPYAWQVRRDQLDDILFRNAAKKGVRAFEGHRVAAVEFDAEGATVEVEVEVEGGARQTWRTRFVVDASGRDTLLANRFDSKEQIAGHRSAAVFGHYTGARRLAGREEGHISIFWFAHGWFWFIPLADGTTSVGAVCWPYYLKSRKKPLVDFFRDTVALAPALAERLEGACLVDDRVQAAGNYSYRSRRCTGERYLMIGDAYTFIDPVFSSGVFLAMQAGVDAVPVIATVLDRPAHAAAARRAFERRMRFGPRAFSWFIFRVTNPTMRDFFMSPENPYRVKEALISLLAGDIYGATPIWRAVRTLKAFYYLISLGNAGRSWGAWNRRRRNVRGDVEVSVT